MSVQGHARLENHIAVKSAYSHVFASIIAGYPQAQAVKALVHEATGCTGVWYVCGLANLHVTCTRIIPPAAPGSLCMYAYMYSKHTLYVYMCTCALYTCTYIQSCTYIPADTGCVNVYIHACRVLSGPQIFFGGGGRGGIKNGV